MTLANLVKVTTATTGTGTLTLGSAIDGGRTLATAVAAGEVADGQYVPYGLKAANGDREAGRGLVGDGGTTLTRTLVNSTTGSLLDLAGTTEVMISPLAEDIEDKPVVVSGGYLMPPNESSGLTLDADTHYALAVRYAGLWVDALTWYGYGGTTGGEVRLGLYASDADGLPGDLLEASGAMSSDSEGFLEYEFAAPRFLKGLYYLTLVCNSAADGLEGEGFSRTGGIPLPSADGYGSHWVASLTFGALPSDYGSPEGAVEPGPAPVVRLA